MSPILHRSIFLTMFIANICFAAKPTHSSSLIWRLVRQNVKYITLDLRKGTGVEGRLLDLDDNVSSIMVPSIVEWYGRRCDESSWAKAYQQCAQEVEDVGLHDFVLEFNYLKTQKLARRAKQGVAALSWQPLQRNNRSQMQSFM